MDKPAHEDPGDAGRHQEGRDLRGHAKTQRQGNLDDEREATAIEAHLALAKEPCGLVGSRHVREAHADLGRLRPGLASPRDLANVGAPCDAALDGKHHEHDRHRVVVAREGQPRHRGVKRHQGQRHQAGNVDRKACPALVGETCQAHEQAPGDDRRHAHAHGRDERCQPKGPHEGGAQRARDAHQGGNHDVEQRRVVVAPHEARVEVGQRPVLHQVLNVAIVAVAQVVLRDVGDVADVMQRQVGRQREREPQVQDARQRHDGDARHAEKCAHAFDGRRARRCLTRTCRMRRGGLAHVGGSAHCSATSPAIRRSYIALLAASSAESSSGSRLASPHLRFRARAMAQSATPGFLGSSGPWT